MRRPRRTGTAKESQNANQNWPICVRLDERSARLSRRKYSAGRLLQCHDRLAWLRSVTAMSGGVGSGRAVGPADGYPGCAAPKLCAAPPGVPRSLGSWPESAAGDRRLPGRPFRRRRGMVIDPWPPELAVYQSGAGICGAGASDDVPACVAPGRCLAVSVFRPGPWRPAGPRDCGAWPPRRHGRTACEGGVSRCVLPGRHHDRRRWPLARWRGNR